MAGVLVGEDVAVVDGVGAPGPDDDVGDGEPVDHAVVDDLDRPGSRRALAAEGLRLEGPVALEALPVADVGDEPRAGPGGRDEVDLEVAEEGGREGDPDAHPLDEVVGGEGAVEGDPVPVPVRDHRLLVEEVEPGRGFVEAGRGRGAGQLPALGEADRRARVDETVAVVVAEVLAAAVPGRGAVPAPGEPLVARRIVADLRADVAGGGGEDRLDVAPAEAVVRVVHERDDAADHRGRRRGAAEEPGVVGVGIAPRAEAVGGHHLAGRSEGRDQQAGAEARVGGDEARAVDGADDDLAGVVGPGIGVGVVEVEAVVAGRLDDRGAEPVAAGVDRGADGVADLPEARRGDAEAEGVEGAEADVRQVGAGVDGGGFDRVADLRQEGVGEVHAVADQLGAVRDPDRAPAVGRRADEAGDRGAVGVERGAEGVVGAGGEIAVEIGVVVPREVVVPVVEAVVDDDGPRAGAAVAGAFGGPPGVEDVEVEASRVGREQVPLLGEQPIGRKRHHPTPSADERNRHRSDGTGAPHSSRMSETTTRGAQNAPRTPLTTCSRPCYRNPARVGRFLLHARRSIRGRPRPGPAPARPASRRRRSRRRRRGR